MVFDPKMNAQSARSNHPCMCFSKILNSITLFLSVLSLNSPTGKDGKKTMVTSVTSRNEAKRTPIAEISFHQPRGALFQINTLPLNTAN
jgi:hypothetical protein